MRAPLCRRYFIGNPSPVGSALLRMKRSRWREWSMIKGVWCPMDASSRREKGKTPRTNLSGIRQDLKNETYLRLRHRTRTRRVMGPWMLVDTSPRAWNRHLITMKPSPSSLHGIVFGTQKLSIHVFVYVKSCSDWGRHSKRCCMTPLGNLAVSTAWQISRESATSSSTGVWNVLFHIPRAEEEAMRECGIHQHVLSRLTALLTWAPSLGWTSALTCCNSHREY